MAAANDFLLRTLDGDLKFTNGDLITGFSDNQHIYDIIHDNPGDWQESPNVGVSITQYINSSKSYTLGQNTKIQLEDDGYDVGQIKINYDWATSKMTIQPNAVRL